LSLECFVDADFADVNLTTPSTVPSLDLGISLNLEDALDLEIPIDPNYLTIKCQK